MLHRLSLWRQQQEMLEIDTAFQLIPPPPGWREEQMTERQQGLDMDEQPDNWRKKSSASNSIIRWSLLQTLCCVHTLSRRARGEGVTCLCFLCQCWQKSIGNLFCSGLIFYSFGYNSCKIFFSTEYKNKRRNSSFKSCFHSRVLIEKYPGTRWETSASTRTGIQSTTTTT